MKKLILIPALLLALSVTPALARDHDYRGQDRHDRSSAFHGGKYRNENRGNSYRQDSSGHHQERFSGRRDHGNQYGKHYRGRHDNGNHYGRSYGHRDRYSYHSRRHGYHNHYRGHSHDHDLCGLLGGALLISEIVHLSSGH